MPGNIKKILRKLKEGLAEVYGDQLKAVILFGSFARGEGHLPNSDMDVMVVLKGEFNYVVATFGKEFAKQVYLIRSFIVPLFKHRNSAKLDIMRKGKNLWKP